MMLVRDTNYTILFLGFKFEFWTKKVLRRIRLTISLFPITWLQ